MMTLGSKNSNIREYENWWKELHNWTKKKGLLFDTTEKYNGVRMHSLSSRWKAEYGEMFNF